MLSTDAHAGHRESPTDSLMTLPADEFRPLPAVTVSRAFEGTALEDHFLEDTVPLPAYRPDRLF